MIGQRLGPYEVVAKLGEGGMGEVYRARDARIGRDVALKVLPETVARDPERVARFQREGQMLGALNHQNIAAIYGVEQDAAVAGAAKPPVLVMELVEGPTLADRIAAGPVPLDEALAMAKQIAEALDAAHESGIVHRDLKPANVKIRPDGIVKVLDFGLAKMSAPAGSNQSDAIAATYSPTFSIAASRAGMIIGTAAYMAPEQARGQIVDKRADVWAFGVVLYEMLTGTKAFPGEDVSDTLATVIKFDPDWSKLPADTPGGIRRLLKRCLTKDPKQRLRELSSALLDIRDAQSGGTPETAATTSTDPRGRSWLPLAAVAIVAAAVGAMSWALMAPTPPVQSQPTRRFTITLPESDTLPSGTGQLLALAPDGQTLVYRAARGTATMLFRRSLDQFDATVIPGSEEASYPMFSPDGASLLFESMQGNSRTIKRMLMAGGPAQTFAAIPAATRGRSWMQDGGLVIALGPAGLMQIPAGGGAPTELFKPPAPKSVASPHVLKNGRVVLFLMSPDSISRDGDLVALNIGSSEPKTILADVDGVRALDSGHLVFIRDASLWAVPFDVDRLEVRGTPLPIVEGVRTEPGGAVQYQIADDGTLVFIPGGSGIGGRVLQFIGTDGRADQVPVSPRGYTAVKLSPDGTRIAVQIEMPDGADVWVVEVARGTLTRLTSEAGFDGNPIWTPDGRHVVFASERDGRWALSRRSADGTGPIERLSSAPMEKQRLLPRSLTRDGSLISTLADDIGMVLDGGRGQWKPLVQTPATELQAEISPDGRWLAFMSDDSGNPQVYLQPFPGMNNRQAVSAENGHTPTWSADGRTLFYLQGGPPRAVMSVTIEPTPGGPARIGLPVKVADWHYFSVARSSRYYDVAADGRLLVIGMNDGATATGGQIQVVLNWQEELKRLVPTH